MSKKGEIDLQLRAADLGLNIDALAAELESEFQSAVEQTANAAYASIIADAQQKLSYGAQDYLKGLKFDKLANNTYLISLDGAFANSLEKGYAPFDMKQKMLTSSAIVKVGERAGQPWVQTSKKGKKFAHVPFSHQPYSKVASGANDLAQAIKKLETLNSHGRKQKLTSIFKDPSGKALQGKVATIRDTGIKNLDGIVKYQKTYTNEKSGRQTTSSIYMTFRTVSENGNGWMHPGFSGIHAFDEAEVWVAAELDKILKAFLG